VDGKSARLEIAADHGPRASQSAVGAHPAGVEGGVVRADVVEPVIDELRIAVTSPRHAADH